MHRLEKLAQCIWHTPRILGAFFVKVYQKTLSPDHGMLKGFFPYGYCPYHPTCSEYTRQAIKKYGLIVGIAKGAWRIMRCNPCSKGGVDRV